MIINVIECNIGMCYNVNISNDKIFCFDKKKGWQFWSNRVIICSIRKGGWNKNWTAQKQAYVSRMNYTLKWKKAQRKKQ